MDKRRRGWLPVICWAGLLTGCTTVGPNYQRPVTPMPEQFANAQQVEQAHQQLHAAWWSTFGDTQLTALIAQARTGNHDQRIALANLREARALRADARFDRYPTVTSTARYQNSNSFNEQELAGFDAFWELDFFGRVRRNIEARDARVAAADARLSDTLVSVFAELARNYFELRGAQQQLAVARKNAENQQASQQWTVDRLAGGRGTDLDVARAREQLNSTLATIPPLEATIKHAIHRISVLTGQLPDTLTAQLQAPRPLPTTTGSIGIGRPAELLRRRPDVRVAERDLAAATADIGVATADLFPQVTFNGSLALQATSGVPAFSSGILNYSFGPTIRWAFLNWWRVKQRIVAASARAEAQAATYERTVLTALEETENALVSFGRQRERTRWLREATADSEKAAHLARLRYEYGVENFLSVLDAERRLLEAQDQLARSETATTTALVAVYKALGGGWEDPAVALQTAAGHTTDPPR